MSARRQRSRLVAAGLAALILATGCGLKQEAADSLTQTGAGGVAAPGAPGGVVGGGSGVAAPGGGPAGGGAVPGGGGTAPGGGGTVAGPGGAGTGGPGSTGTNAPGGSGGGGGGGSAACGVPTGGNTTGITASTINIGLHAPLTGTGTPFPNSSFTEAAQKYWDQPGRKICGRTVKVEIQDDTYTPNGARNVCTAMARRDFLVVGGAGTDQIQACALTPEIQRTNTPYLSAGVTTNGLTELDNYFATSLSYAQQGGIAVQAAQQYGYAKPAPARTGKQWAVVTGEGRNFEDARQGIFAALNAAGISYEDIRVDQGGNYEGRAVGTGQRLALQRYKTIYVVAAPGYAVFMVGGYYNNGGTGATWTGPGIQYTQMTSAQLMCTGSSGRIHGQAYFLAPNPGIDRASADFKKAFNNDYDSIMWIIWGLSEGLFQMLKNASNNLTRENFIARTYASSFAVGSFAPIRYAGKTHFGGTGAWMQKIDCRDREPNQDQAGTWDTVGSTYFRA